VCRRRQDQHPSHPSEARATILPRASLRHVLSNCHIVQYRRPSYRRVSHGHASLVGIHGVHVADVQLGSW
jgi:hypothetical protein